jgi:hypothetical protein
MLSNRWPQSSGIDLRTGVALQLPIHPDADSLIVELHKASDCSLSLLEIREVDVAEELVEVAPKDRDERFATPS